MFSMKKTASPARCNRCKEMEQPLREGEGVEMAKNPSATGQLVSQRNAEARPMPDFMGRMRAIYGDKLLVVSGAKLIAKDRARY